MHAESTMFEVESTCKDYALIRYYWPKMLAVCNTSNEYMCDDVSFGHPIAGRSSHSQGADLSYISPDNR